MSVGWHWRRLLGLPVTAMALLALLLALIGGLIEPKTARASVPDTVTAALPSAALPSGGLPSDFSRLDVGWLVVEYHPSLAVSARRLSEVGADARQELQTLLGKPVLARVTTRIGRTAGEMELLAPPGAKLPRYASGVAFSEQALILLTAAPRYAGERHDLAEAFRHELSHVALHEAVGREHVPRWFNEGFAVHTSGEAETARIQALWTATLADTLIPLERLGTSFPEGADEASIAYAESADLVRYLLKGGQEHRFGDLLDRLRQGQAFDAALADAYGTTLFALERDWKRDLAKRYTFWPVLFGGSLVWVLGLVLLVLGYTKRRKRAQQKLLTWAREEAAEDARRELALAVLRQAGPVRVILGPTSGATDARAGALGRSPDERDGGTLGEADPAGDGPVQPPGASGLEPARAPGRATLLVPKVEHDGGWHTLH